MVLEAAAAAAVDARRAWLEDWESGQEGGWVFRPQTGGLRRQPEWRELTGEH